MIFQAIPEELDELFRVLAFWDHLLLGLGKTMWLYAWALVIGFFLGLLLSILRQYGGRIISRIATGYVEIVRGTPLLAQLFFLYFLPFSLNSFLEAQGLPFIPIGRWSFYVRGNLFGRSMTMVLLDHQTLIGILVLGLNSAAYQAEYLRG
ncbi:MAG: ABC transporter permease subunit, partial [Candidatus Ranarchaeia archaeon]